MFFTDIRQEGVNGGVGEAHELCHVVFNFFFAGVLRELGECLDGFGRDPDGLRVGHAEHLHAHLIELHLILHDPPIHGIEDLIVEGLHGVSELGLCVTGRSDHAHTNIHSGYLL